MPITLTIALYSFAWLNLIRCTRKKLAHPGKLHQALIAAALLAHGFAIHQQIVVPGGYHFGFFKISSLFFWVTNLLVFLSSLRLPLHNLFLLTLPVSVAALLASLFTGHPQVLQVSDLSLGVASHIFLSILAYSTMIVATGQALLLAYQDYMLHHKHPAGFTRVLPPLQTMETLLFEILWTGQILLTLVIITGVTQTQDVAQQHLHHKIAFTAVAWVIYAILLWGRYFLGWRGRMAIRWTLSGFACLILAYWGTKIVFEFLLNQGAYT